MNTPPFLIGAALLFWGWQTGLLAAAVPTALLIEAHRMVPWRMQLRERDFSRIWKVCAAAFLAVFLLLFPGEGAKVLQAFQWMPLLFFPLAAAQSFSTSAVIESRILFLWIRTKPFNLGYPFLLVVLLAAGAAPARTPWFFPGLAAAVGWTLWSARPARRSRVVWMLLFAAVSAAGFAGAVELRELQKKVEELYIGTFTREVDPSRVRTSIGDIGRRKQSDAIELRVRDRGGSRMELLLARSSYNVYKGSSWFTRTAPLAAAVGSGEGWRLRPEDRVTGEVEISVPLRGGEGYLVAPADAAAVNGLRARSLLVNRLGGLKAEGAPGLAVYRVQRSAGTFFGPPDADDLAVPAEEAPVLAAVAGEIGLPSRKGDAILEQVRRFFEDRFTYTLDLASGRENATPLADFLLRTRAGHCEYFATAGALLLRRAGVPARYVVGYLAHEYRPREKGFVVRSRDAHAWVLAYVDGAWRTFDPTPASWVEEERKEGGLFGPVRDLWSYLSFRFSRWRWSGGSEAAARWGRRGITAVLAALLALIAVKARKRFRFPGAKAPEQDRERTRPGEDSPFFGIERLLGGTEWERRQGETYTAWLGRIDGRSGLSVAGLAAALALHNRYRFDPEGITGEERERLDREVEAWMAGEGEVIGRRRR